MGADRKILITSADGQTGHLAAELLLTDEEFKAQHGGIVLTARDLNKVEDLQNNYGAEVVELDYDTDSVDDMVKKMKDSGADTIYLIPPAHTKKLDIVKNMIGATKKAEIQNTLLLSSAGCDLATRSKQPRLREFIDMEVLFMECKGDTSTKAGSSPAIIRAGFYAENLLLYNKNAQDTGKLPLPAGKSHKFAPVALGDVAHLAGAILVSEGPHGFSDDYRGQLITLTGPQMVSGSDLATSASQSLSTPMEYEEISEKTAREILSKQTDIDSSEQEYLLEYYSLVREGKTNYVSTLAFRAVTGADPTLPSEFFEDYQEEFKPKRRKTGKATATKMKGGEGEGEGDTVGSSGGSGRGRGRGGRGGGKQ